MSFPFSRVCATAMLLAIPGMTNAQGTQQKLPKQALAPTSLEGATIKITNALPNAPEFRRVIRLGSMLPVGETGQEYRENLRLTDPIILVNQQEGAVLTDFEYGFKPAADSTTPSSEAFLAFQYRIGPKNEATQYQFDYDFSFDQMSGESSLPCNVRFTHKDRQGLHGVIEGWEMKADDTDTPSQQTYNILIAFSDQDADDESEAMDQDIAEQQKKAFLANNNLNPDFVNWIVEQRMEQIMSDKASAEQYISLYAPQVLRQKDRKLISREDMILTQMAFIDQFPKRSYLLKEIGILKNSIQISAVFLYFHKSGKEYNGYLTLTLFIDKEGKICEIGEQLDTRKALKLSRGYRQFPYKGNMEFVSVD